VKTGHQIQNGYYEGHFQALEIFRNVGCEDLKSRNLTQLYINPLTPNDLYKRRTAQLTSRHYILYIYSTNIHTEYFKHAA